MKGKYRTKLYDETDLRLRLLPIIPDFKQNSHVLYNKELTNNIFSVDWLNRQRSLLLFVYKQREPKVFSHSLVTLYWKLTNRGGVRWNTSFWNGKAFGQENKVTQCCACSRVIWLNHMAWVDIKGHILVGFFMPVNCVLEKNTCSGIKTLTAMLQNHEQKHQIVSIYYT